MNRFREKLGRGEFVKSAEIHPPSNVQVDSTLQWARDLAQLGLDALNVVDSPVPGVRVSPLAFAYVLKEEAGIQPILHFTCRDRSLPRIQSDLLGAHLLQIQTVLALTGDPPNAGEYPQATVVEDLHAGSLIQLIHRLKEGKDVARRPLTVSRTPSREGGARLPTTDHRLPSTVQDSPSRGRDDSSTSRLLDSSTSHLDFFVGTAVNPGSLDLDKEIEKDVERIRDGCDFLMTQPVFQPDAVRRFVEALYTALDGEKLPRVPVIMGLFPPKNTQQAEYLLRVPGLGVPPLFMEALGKYNGNEEACVRSAVEYLARLVESVRDVIQGFYFVPTLLDPTVYQALMAIG